MLGDDAWPSLWVDEQAGEESRLTGTATVSLVQIQVAASALRKVAASLDDASALVKSVATMLSKMVQN